MELLVALVISGILASIVFQLLQGQGEFARLQTAREEVQQNARAAVEIITGELRGLGPDSTLVSTRADSIKFASPRAWGIVCVSGANRLSVLFPSFANRAFRTSYGGSVTADRVAVRDTSGNWTLMQADDATAANIGTARNECSGGTVGAQFPNEGSDTSRVRYFDLGGSIVPAAHPSGSRVYLFDWITYAVDTSNAPGEWIRRTENNAAPQPMAGPLLPGAGLRFRYFDNAGNEVTPVAISQMDSVASVRVVVVMNSRAKFGGVAQDQADSGTVYLRNRLCTVLSCN